MNTQQPELPALPRSVEIREYAARLLTARPNLTQEELRAALVREFLPGLPVEAISLDPSAGGCIYRPSGPFCGLCKISLASLRIAYYVALRLLKRDKATDEATAKAISAIISELCIVY